ncbi:hypothetical protein WUBG_17248, partial [Wuchereria bancrofti]
MKTTGILLLWAVCVALSLSVRDECMERHKICSVKDRFTMQRICRKSGGLLKHTLKYAGKGLFKNKVTNSS